MKKFISMGGILLAVPLTAFSDKMADTKSRIRHRQVNYASRGQGSLKIYSKSKLRCNCSWPEGAGFIIGGGTEKH
jgi:hypothetical protein